MKYWIFVLTFIFSTQVFAGDDNDNEKQKQNFYLEIFPGVTGISGRRIISSLDYRAIYYGDEGRLVYKFNSLPIYFSAPYGFNTFISLNYTTKRKLSLAGAQLWMFDWGDFKQGQFRVLEMNSSGIPNSDIKSIRYRARSRFSIKVIDAFVLYSFLEKGNVKSSFYMAFKVADVNYLLKIRTGQNILHKSAFSFFDGNVNIIGSHKTEYSTLFGPSAGVNFSLKKQSGFGYESFLKQTILFGSVKHIGDLDGIVSGKAFYIFYKDTVNVYYKNAINFSKNDFTFFPVSEIGFKLIYAFPERMFNMKVSAGLGGIYSLWWDMYFGPMLNGMWEIGQPFDDNNLRWRPRSQNIGFYNGFFILGFNF